MCDYTNLVLKAEEELYVADWQKQTGRKISLYNSVWEIEVDDYYVQSVRCLKLLPGIDTCRAEVLFISDSATIETWYCKEFEAGKSVNNPSFQNSVVIRVFEEKQKILKEFDERSAADVTFLGNGEECKGDRKYLAGVSRVFNAMLYGQFAEAEQEKIVLEGIESVEIFKDFLLAVSPLRVQPNPDNVVALLELANQYDIPFLVRNCEDHLKSCYEIPLVDRLFLAGKYGLNTLKLRLTEQMSKDNVLQFLMDERVQFQA